MTRYKFNQAIKGQGNSVRVIEGVTVARVQWLDMPWRVVENGKTFDEISNRANKPLKEFRNSEDLFNEVFKNI